MKTEKEVKKRERQKELADTLRDFLGHPDKERKEPGAHQPGTRLEDSKVEALRIAKDHESWLTMRDKEKEDSGFHWLVRQELFKNGKVNESVMGLKLILELFRSMFGLEHGDKSFKIFMETCEGMKISVPSIERQRKASDRSKLRKIIQDDYKERFKEYAEELQPGADKQHKEVKTISSEGQVTTELPKPNRLTRRQFESEIFKKRIAKPSRENYKSLSEKLDLSEQEIKDRTKEERKWILEQEQKTGEMVEQEINFFAERLLQLFEKMKSIDEIDSVKKALKKRPKEEIKKARFETEKRQKELMRKQGMSEDKIEALDKAKDDVELSEVSENLKQIKSNE